MLRSTIKEDLRKHRGPSDRRDHSNAALIVPVACSQACGLTAHEVQVVQASIPPHNHSTQGRNMLVPLAAPGCEC